MVSFPNAVKSGFQGYFGFGGRSTRAEYWWFVLFTTIASVVLNIVDMLIGTTSGSTGLLSGIFSLAVLIPQLALSFRRLHDIGRSAWWLFIALTGIGIILLIVWYCKSGDDGENQYGARKEI
ncbi:DUF805 domain-containing protein [Dehalococcoidia bacterium]|nr:DUF805 domain-containing protein [Dehalococcoidia bacterium]